MRLLGCVQSVKGAGEEDSSKVDAADDVDGATAAGDSGLSVDAHAEDMQSEAESEDGEQDALTRKKQKQKHDPQGSPGQGHAKQEDHTERRGACG